MAFGFDVNGIGAQIGGLTKEGLERLNENLEAYIAIQRRMTNFSIATVASQSLDDTMEARGQRALRHLMDEVEADMGLEPIEE